MLLLGACGESLTKQSGKWNAKSQRGIIDATLNAVLTSGFYVRNTLYIPIKCSLPPHKENTAEIDLYSECQQQILSPMADPTYSIIYYDKLYRDHIDPVGLYSRSSNLHMRNPSCVDFMLQKIMEKCTLGHSCCALASMSSATT